MIAQLFFKNGRRLYGTGSSLERHDRVDQKGMFTCPSGASSHRMNTAIHCSAGYCEAMSREGRAFRRGAQAHQAPWIALEPEMLVSAIKGKL
jgi:hypothetical protein